jgi:hypothetical protein
MRGESLSYPSSTKWSKRVGAGAMNGGWEKTRRWQKTVTTGAVQGKSKAAGWGRSIQRIKHDARYSFKC